MFTTTSASKAGGAVTISMDNEMLITAVVTKPGETTKTFQDSDLGILYKQIAEGGNEKLAMLGTKAFCRTVLIQFKQVRLNRSNFLLSHKKVFAKIRATAKAVKPEKKVAKKAKKTE